MTTPRVAILRAEKLPSFVTWIDLDSETIFEEDDHLVRTFRARGWDAHPVVWTSRDTDWSEYDLAIVRSTFDYFDEYAEFLRVLEAIDRSTSQLWNSMATIRWNIDKHYLFDLEERGVAIVPTLRWSGSSTPDESDGSGGSTSSRLGGSDGMLLHALGTHPFDGDLVTKPIVGLGGSGTQRTSARALREGLARGVRETQRMSHGDAKPSEVLVQPYIDSIVSEGEWSFVFFNRRFAYAMLKKPAKGEYRVQTIYGGTIEHLEPRLDDLARARAALDAVPYDSLYARVDMVRMDGGLRVMEIELIEPVLSFGLVPQAADWFVDATEQRLVRSRRERH